MSVKIISIHASGLPASHKYKQGFFFIFLHRGVCLLCGREPSGMSEYFYTGRDTVEGRANWNRGRSLLTVCNSRLMQT